LPAWITVITALARFLWIFPIEDAGKIMRQLEISINNTPRRKGDENAVKYYIISKPLTGEEFA